MTHVRFDYWTISSSKLGLKLVNTTYENGDPKKEALVTVPSIVKGGWVSVDIPLSEYTNDTSKFMQLVWDGAAGKCERRRSNDIGGVRRGGVVDTVRGVGNRGRRCVAGRPAASGRGRSRSSAAPGVR